MKLASISTLLCLGLATSAAAESATEVKTERAAEAVADQYGEEVQESLAELEDPEFLVFLAPDPVDSHYARDFDVYLSAFRQAMGSMGFELQRFEMTWPRFGPDGTPIGRARGALETSIEVRAALTRYRRTPSVMIFGDGSRSVVVFVVGETPTWGLQTRAFRSALERIPFVGKAAATRAAQGRIQVGVVGPTYSGTAASLGKELARWEQKANDGDGTAARIGWMQVLSGTASNASNRAAFRGLQKVRYDQLPASSTERVEKLIEHAIAVDRRIDCKNIVILRESSPFGAASENTRPGRCEELRSVTYPINISALRNAHGQAEAPKPASLGANPLERLDSDPVFQVSRLPISLSGTATPDDRVPIYGDDLTPQTLDMVVANTLRAINVDDTRAIGIVGTNVRDKLFLAGEIAKHADGIRLLTDEPDVLLAHPRFSFAAHGILTIASNPMVEEIAGTRYHFASDAAHGVFRATRRQVEELRAGCDQPEIRGTLAWCGSPKLQASTMWIGIVGRGRIIPSGRVLPGSQPSPGWEPYSPAEYGRRSWGVVCLILAGAGLLFGWRVCADWDFSRRATVVASSITPAVLVLAAEIVQRYAHQFGPLRKLADLGDGFFRSLSDTPPGSLWVLPAAAFGPVVATVAMFGDELVFNLWNKTCGRLEKWRGATPQRERVFQEIVGPLYAAQSLLVLLLLVPYYFAAQTLLQSRHLDLDGGASLIPPAVLAHVCLTGLVLLLIERDRLRRRGTMRAENRRRLVLFGFTSKPWIWRLVVAGAILAAIALDIAGVAMPLAHALEGSLAVEATINLLWLSLAALAIEAMIFAHHAACAGRRQAAILQETTDQMLTLGRFSLVAGPATFLLFLLTVEVYPFEPRGLLTLIHTVLVGCSVAAALWILLQFEDGTATGAPQRNGLTGWLGIFSRERIPLGAVAAVSVVGLLPNVRERLGGLVDLLARLIG